MADATSKTRNKRSLKALKGMLIKMQSKEMEEKPENGSENDELSDYLVENHLSQLMEEARRNDQDEEDNDEEPEEHCDDVAIEEFKDEYDHHVMEVFKNQETCVYYEEPSEPFLVPTLLIEKTCLKYGDRFPPPLTTFDTPRFSKDFRKRLKELKYVRPSPLQAHVFPCVLQGNSVFCVSSAKSGKTNSYLIPCINTVIADGISSDNGIVGGAKMIVLCSSFRKVRSVKNELCKLRGDNAKPSFVCLDSVNEKNQLTPLLNGCDVIISTPNPLLRYIEENIINLLKCKLIVLDDGDKALILHCDTMKEIAKRYYQVRLQKLDPGEQIDHVLASQTLIYGEKFTQQMASFSQTQNKPVTIFGNYFEAAISLQIKCNISFCDNEINRAKALKEAVQKYVVQANHRITVVCQDAKESSFVTKSLTLRLMKDRGDQAIEINEDTEFYKYQNLIAKWECSKRNVLVITDKAFEFVPQIQHSTCLIHYSLPNLLKGVFSARFKLMSKCLEEKSSSGITHIIISNENQPQIHQIYQFLKRLRVEIPKELQTFKNSVERPLCERYAAFGECKIRRYFCFDRHSFKKSEEAWKWLPEDGQIKIKISHVESANKVYFQLCEYRNKSHFKGKWQPIVPACSFSELEKNLSAYRNARLGMVRKIEIGDIFAVAVRETVRRVKIVRVIGDEKLEHYQTYDKNRISLMLEVFHMDYGYTTQCRSYELIDIPEDLKKVPVCAYKGYLVGIKPNDNEIEWYFESTQFLFEKVMGKSVSYITAWILLQRNGEFWLDKMRVHTKLKHMNTVIVSSKPILELIEKNLATKNEDKKLPLFNKTHNEIQWQWRSDWYKTWAQYAFLQPNGLTEVHLYTFFDINEMYVRLPENRNILLDLEKDIRTMAEKKELVPLPFGTEGMFCICFHERYNAYNRAKILRVFDESKFKVFFLDYGEELDVDKSQLYEIHKQFITKLPFQAIKCSLFGVKGDVNPDIIYEFTSVYDMPGDYEFSTNFNYKSCLAKKLEKTDDTNVIQLYVNTCEVNDENLPVYISLSKYLTDIGKAEYSSESEEIAQPYIAYKKVEQLNENVIAEDDDEDVEDWLLKEEEAVELNFMKKVFGIPDEVFEASSPSDPKQYPFKPKKSNAICNGEVARQGDEDNDEDLDTDIKPLFRPVPDYQPGDFDYEYFDDEPRAYDPESDEDENEENLFCVAEDVL